jgi:hypothetical protein
MIVFPRAGRRSSAATDTQADSTPERRSGSTQNTAPSAPYGWSDRARGSVFIPIEHAKDLYLSRQRGTTAVRGTGAERQP